MEIKRESLVPILGRPVVPEANRQAAVGVTAAQGVGARTHFAGLLPGFAGIPVVMIGRLVNLAIAIRRQALAIHALIICARDAVPQVPDHRIDEKEFAVLIPIVPPGICRPLAHYLEQLSRRMVAPDGSIDFCPLLSGVPWFPDREPARIPMPAIKPTVRSPFQTVHNVMPHGIVIPPIEQDFWWTIRHVIAVAIRNEN